MEPRLVSKRFAEYFLLPFFPFFFLFLWCTKARSVLLIARCFNDLQSWLESIHIALSAGIKLRLEVQKNPLLLEEGAIGASWQYGRASLYAFYEKSYL